jgi:hypothetical protein
MDEKINWLKLHLNATPCGGRFNHSWNPQRTIKTIAAEARTNECIQKHIMLSVPQIEALHVFSSWYQGCVFVEQKGKGCHFWSTLQKHSGN